MSDFAQKYFSTYKVRFLDSGVLTTIILFPGVRVLENMARGGKNTGSTSPRNMDLGNVHQVQGRGRVFPQVSARGIHNQERPGAGLGKLKPTLLLVQMKLLLVDLLMSGDVLNATR